MSETVLNELGDYLVTEDSYVLGGASGTLFLGKLSSNIAACLALIETGGAPGETGFGTAGVKFEFPTVMVVARGVADDYTTPRDNCEKALRSLAEIEAETLGAGVYLWAQVVNPPSSILGQDEQDRWLVSANIMFKKEPTAP